MSTHGVSLLVPVWAETSALWTRALMAHVYIKLEDSNPVIQQFTYAGGWDSNSRTVLTNNIRGLIDSAD